MNDELASALATLGAIAASVALLAYGAWRLLQGSISSAATDSDDEKERTSRRRAGVLSRLLVYVSGISVLLYAAIVGLLVVYYAVKAFFRPA